MEVELRHMMDVFVLVHQSKKAQNANIAFLKQTDF